jgi:GNAT superfamily N-acetyltransferase
LGWIGIALLAVLILSIVALLTHEVISVFRQRHIAKLHANFAMARLADDRDASRRLTGELTALYAARPETAQVRAHIMKLTREIIDGRDLCDIAERDGEPVGFALWFYNFSTFQGRAGIYLEDLYVRPSARRSGVGGALLQHLARRCVDQGLGRLCWSVLDWNKPAIAFYQGLGARLTEDWVGCRLEGEALGVLGGPA